MTGVTPLELENLLERGWRRFGPVYFRPVCATCDECVSVRVPVETFAPSPNLRRVLKRGAHVRLEVGEPVVDEVRLALYRRWHESREEERGWKPDRIGIDPTRCSSASLTPRRASSRIGRTSSWWASASPTRRRGPSRRVLLLRPRAVAALAGHLQHPPPRSSYARHRRLGYVYLGTASRAVPRCSTRSLPAPGKASRPRRRRASRPLGARVKLHQETVRIEPPRARAARRHRPGPEGVAAAGLRTGTGERLRAAHQRVAGGPGERGSGGARDLQRFLARIVPENAITSTTARDRMTCLRTSAPPSPGPRAAAVSGGDLALGTWQAIYLWSIAGRRTSAAWWSPSGVNSRPLAAAGRAGKRSERKIPVRTVGPPPMLSAHEVQPPYGPLPRRPAQSRGRGGGSPRGPDVQM